MPAARPLACLSPFFQHLHPACLAYSASEPPAASPLPFWTLDAGPWPWPWPYGGRDPDPDLASAWSAACLLACLLACLPVPTSTAGYSVEPWCLERADPYRAVGSRRGGGATPPQRAWAGAGVTGFRRRSRQAGGVRAGPGRTKERADPAEARARAGACAQCWLSHAHPTAGPSRGLGAKRSWSWSSASV
ncbi:uncharacterized protein PSFLO_01272 [Pseudozyma flocculosa]|uniref:Uncharacterized protein n=1 Tax=Pseudozyma flocculosa TaxID=84751 RepID=A0A5C3EXI5_9BASI|nr:uncharacterized protein PSFLO_01272 [Pseudozyma flocculosa]